MLMMKPFAVRAVQIWASGAAIVMTAALPLFAQRLATTNGDQATATEGDAAAGRALFESNKCLDCHRVGPNGSRFGPDLSDIGARRPPELLGRAIVAPDEQVLPEHRSARVITRDGATVVGRLLNQDSFSVQVITATEQLVSYDKSNVREVTILQKGLMPSYEGTLSAQQLANIVAYLASLKRDEGGASATSVSSERILRADREPQNWLTYSGGYASQR